MPNAVQPSRGRGKPGEQSNHAAPMLFQPRIQLPGRGDLGPLVERAARDGGRVPGGGVVHRRLGVADVVRPYQPGRTSWAERN